MAPIIAAGIIAAGASLANTGAQMYGQSQANRTQEKLAKEKAERISNATAKADSDYEQMLQMLDEYRQGQTQFSSPEMVQSYKDLVSGYNPEAMTYDFMNDVGKFSDNYNKSEKDFITPYFDQIINGVTSKVSNTAAGAGLGRSSGTAYDIAEAVAQKENELYRTAMQDYQADRNFAYKEYQDYITNMQNKYNQMANLTSQQINLMGGAIQHDEQQESDYMADLLGLMQDRSKTDVTAAMYS